VSLNRWVFKWHLKVRMFSHSRMKAVRHCASVTDAIADKSAIYRASFSVTATKASREDRLYILQSVD